MREQFPGYYRPSEVEFEAIWQACLFVVDANVLLNMYGYSEGTREELLGLFERRAPRLRIPYQFALEYQRNRARAIMEQVKNYVRVEKALKDLHEEEFTPKTKHPFLSDDMLGAFSELREHLAESHRKHEELFSKDIYFDRLTALFAGRVGKRPTDAEIDGLRDLARKRYAREIPPGYADLKEKGEPGAFGDFIGWSQILDLARAEKKPVVLITDDAKEDWWAMQSGRTTGPRPELLDEFLSECGEAFYMYSSVQFMNYARERLNEPVEQRAIEEVKERLQTKALESIDIKPTVPEGPSEVVGTKGVPPSERAPPDVKPDFRRPSSDAPDELGDKPTGD